MENKQSDYNLNGTSLIQMVWDRKIIFIVIGLIAFVVSAVVSFIITPQFQSSAILIPSAATQASKDVLVPSRAKGITVFGDDEEVEHLLQVLSSNSLRKVVIDAENLYKHYEIDPEASQARFRVNSRFSGRVSFMRTRYRTVRIEVLDHCPDKAASIANTIVKSADSIMRETKRGIAQTALELLERQYNIVKEEAFEINSKLSQVMESGVLDLPYQAKEATKQYVQALAAGNTQAASRLGVYMNELAKYGADFTRYVNDIQYKSIQLKNMEESIHILRVEAEGLIPSQFVIDWAVPSDVKAKPKRGIIVIVSTLTTLFFAIFLFVVVDFFRKSLNTSLK